MPSYNCALYLVVLTTAIAVSATPAAYGSDYVDKHIGRRQFPIPGSLCTDTSFYCDLGVTSPNVYHGFDYNSLTFGPVPPYQSGNPATDLFCLGTTCDPSSIISIEIDGTQAGCNTPTSSDPMVVIRYPILSGYTYTKEHIWIGQGLPPNAQFGMYPFTTDKGYCSPACTASAICTIQLEAFLQQAGVPTDCTDSSKHAFNIVTHAAVDGTSSATGTSDGTCINPGSGGACDPWFKYATITYTCIPCTLCNTCSCSNYAATDCTCPTNPKYQTCDCPAYNNNPANKCKCNPDCTCPDYVAANPDKCYHWCPDVDTAYGYFATGPTPANYQPPSYQAQFNKPNTDGQSLTNKNC